MDITKVYRVPPYVLVGAVLLAALNLTNIHQVLTGGWPSDWTNYVIAGERAWAGGWLYVSGDLYRPDSFSYNPLLAYAFGILPVLGWAGWVGLHVAAAVAMPRPLGLVALATFPWWWDALAGNLVTFIVLAAAWALRGKGWAIAATFVLAALIPRPIMVPLVLWLLWQHPRWRLRFVVLWAVVGLGTLATGHAFDWLASLTKSGVDMWHEWNMSPSRFIGAAWIPVGVTLAALALRKGYVGLACLAASPYLLPYYLMFGLLDLGRADRQTVAGTRSDEGVVSGVVSPDHSLRTNVAPTHGTNSQPYLGNQHLSRGTVANLDADRGRTRPANEAHPEPAR